jgi:hypothetical protein
MEIVLVLPVVVVAVAVMALYRTVYLRMFI